MWVVDLRCLQDDNYKDRGVGFFSLSVLQDLRNTTDEIVGLFDQRAQDVALDVSSQVDSLVSLDQFNTREDYFLLCLSPMTHDVAHLRVLAERATRSAAIVYDFIPLEFPTHYLRDSYTSLEYLARLRVLLGFDAYWCISAATRDRVLQLADATSSALVVWPDALAAPCLKGTHPMTDSRGPVLVTSGREARKQGGVALWLGAVAAADEGRELEVLGLHPDDVREDLGMFLKRMGVKPHWHRGVARKDIDDAYSRACFAITSSLAEGLSLPIIESVHGGTPVFASRIDVHQELVSDGPWLFGKRTLPELSVQLAEFRMDLTRVLRVQTEALEAHSHVAVSHAVELLISAAEMRAAGKKQTHLPSSDARTRSYDPPILISPLPPTPSGIADFSQHFVQTANAMGTELSVMEDSFSLPNHWPHFVDALESDSAKVIAVLGNSSHHLGAMHLAETGFPLTICHDTRIHELNVHRFGWAEAAAIASSESEKVTEIQLKRWFNGEADISSRGYGRLASRGIPLVFHSRDVLNAVVLETSDANVHFATFPIYIEVPTEPVTAFARDAARRAMGLSAQDIVVVVPGAVDTRTKATLGVVRSAQYLAGWGYDVTLVFVGACSETAQSEIEAMRLNWLPVQVMHTGIVSAEEYALWLQAATVGVCLRSRPELSLSGSLMDLNAYGVPTLTHEFLARDCGLLSNSLAVEPGTGSLQWAEALEALITEGSVVDVDEWRRYVDERSMNRYVTRIIELIELLNDCESL